VVEECEGGIGYDEEKVSEREGVHSGDVCSITNSC
jgi:hypothetical protein